jgi:hypothetical protein
MRGNGGSESERVASRTDLNQTLIGGFETTRRASPESLRAAGIPAAPQRNTSLRSRSVAGSAANTGLSLGEPFVALLSERPGTHGRRRRW